MLKQEYIHWRNKLTHMKRQKKEQYYVQQFKKSAGNIKNTWNTIKNAMYNGSPPIKNQVLTQDTDNIESIKNG